MFSFLVDLWPPQTRERLPLPPGGTGVHQAPKPGKESDLTYPLHLLSTIHNYSYCGKPYYQKHCQHIMCKTTSLAILRYGTCIVPDLDTTGFTGVVLTLLMSLEYRCGCLQLLWL